LSLPCGHY